MSRQFCNVTLTQPNTPDLRWSVHFEERHDFAAEMYARSWIGSLKSFQGSTIDDHGRTIDRFDGGTIIIENSPAK